MLEKYYFPYHRALKKKIEEIKEKYSKVFLIDAHSMPSKGTELHRDPGKVRNEVVVSDQNGKSAERGFSELVVQAFKQAGFKVSKNWPYKGGYITQNYGQPEKGENAIQVEINRALYMNEETKEIFSRDKIQNIQERLKEALQWILKHLKTL